MINYEIKVKVKRLESRGGPGFSPNYSSEIETLINDNPELKDEEGSYLLSDFKIIQIGDNPYIVLRYEREM